MLRTRGSSSVDDELTLSWEATETLVMRLLRLCGNKELRARTVGVRLVPSSAEVDVTALADEIDRVAKYAGRRGVVKGGRPK